MAVITLACHAMATRFELVLCGENPVALRAAGEEALEEIERLEARLSLFRPSSEIAHLNGRAAREPVRVTPGLFALLQRAQKLTEESEGAFDITIAPLVRCWGFMGGTGRLPRPDELAQARTCVGMQLVELNPEDGTVRFKREGVMLDLGALGKGYAIERAADVLRDAGVGSALLHGGTSTAYGLGAPPDAESWKVAIRNPLDVVATTPGQPVQMIPLTTSESSSGARQTQAGSGPAPGVKCLTAVPLRDEAISVSAVWGKSFTAGGRTYGHVLDPRTGEPVTGAVLAAVVLPSATETDALSTALLTLGLEGHERLAGLRRGMRTLVVAQGTDGFVVRGRGIETSARGI